MVSSPGDTFLRVLEEMPSVGKKAVEYARLYYGMDKTAVEIEKIAGVGRQHIQAMSYKAKKAAFSFVFVSALSLPKGNDPVQR